MNTIHLHGRLGDEFGGPYQMEIRDPAEAVRALSSQLPAFEESVRKGTWRVVRGDEEISEEELELSLGSKDLHLIPVAHGAGDGTGKTILGAVLIVGSFFAGPAGPYMMNAGIALVTAGVTVMLAPTPGTDGYEEDGVDKKQSFLFDGPVNVQKQGVAVPLIYGEIITGSVVISAGIRNQEL